MEIAVTSVPSTGTNWLLTQLKPYYGEPQNMNDAIRKHPQANLDAPLQFTHYAISGVRAQDIVKHTKDVPLLTPLRDPLLSMTTWCARGWLGADATKRLSGWIDLAAVDRQRTVVYIPIDLPEVAKERMSRMGFYANTDQVINTRGQGNKAKYAAGDFSYLPAWARAWLVEHEKHLRPLLEREGYHKLQWWS